ncbi:hypothetical protein [Chitinophaga sp. YIM B06452]|uniref:hypothetical protein n=1 Tax=Chitinophaga sp. YIM B06452 TaxID=3082158 RepID=UPI0031FEFB45
MNIRSRVIKTEPVEWRKLQFLQADNFKAWTPSEREKLRQSLISNEFSQPFYVWQSPEGVLYCLDGFHRAGVLREIGEEGTVVPDLLPATFIECADRQDAARLVLQYSSVYATVTESGMLDFLDAFELGFEDTTTLSLPGLEISSMFPDRFDVVAAESQKQEARSSLAERFIVPPFSVLDTRQGYWQDRKRKWHALGFDSQESREEIDIISPSGQPPAIYALRNEMREKQGKDPSWPDILAEADRRGIHYYSGASVFDPVLCEVLYTGFCPPAATVLDPFAGGSVRGIVAGALGYQYHGIDLRGEQVTVNRKQATAQELSVLPIWYQGDSANIENILPNDHRSDFLFSCPPYFDLEHYSDDGADLSNMPWDQFCDIYRSIICKTAATLNDKRFACFVVGEIRDKQGAYRDFVGETIRAFREAGLIYYNEIILLNTAGSLPIRVSRQFANYRKVGKTHQNVLVFYKGDPKAISREFPALEIATQEDCAPVL